MTNSNPPESDSPKTSTLGFDEAFAILFALVSIGGIFFWAITQKPGSWRLAGLSETPLILPLQNESPATTKARVPAEKVQPSGGTQPGVTRLNPATPLLLEDPKSPSTQTVPSAKASVLPTVVVPVTPRGEDTDDLEPSAEVNPSPTPAKQSVTQTKPKVPPLVPLVAVPVPTNTKPVKYSDIPNDYWAGPFIYGLPSRSIVGGSDLYFQPSQPVTRAEFAAMLEGGFSTKITKDTEQFKDVPSSFWAVPAIKKASGSGFIEGYPDNTFQPKEPISRAEVIVALASGLGLKEPANPDQVLQRYKDAAEIPAYARKKVAAATQAGLIVNHPNQQALKPKQNATRAEAAALVYQALVKQGKAKAVNSKFIIKP